MNPIFDPNREIKTIVIGNPPEEPAESAEPANDTALTVPIHRKMNLTIREAAAYSNIGINKITEMLKTPNCPFVLYVGSKKLVKRKAFQAYLEDQLVI